MTIRQLDNSEVTRPGDLVTIAKDARDGYRPIQGLVGYPAGEYSYPIYRAVIELTPAEIQSGHTRIDWAESLIRQLPEDHDGRNSWLLNYGKRDGEDMI